MVCRPELYVEAGFVCVSFGLRLFLVDTFVPILLFANRLYILWP